MATSFESVIETQTARQVKLQQRLQVRRRLEKSIVNGLDEIRSDRIVHTFISLQLYLLIYLFDGRVSPVLAPKFFIRQQILSESRGIVTADLVSIKVLPYNQ